MTKPLITLIALVALAGPASAADSVRISLAGKTPQTIRADIAHAAQTVCAQSYGSAAFGRYRTSACVRDTVQATEADLGMTPPKASPDKLAAR
jgi:hypothetical protein